MTSVVMMRPLDEEFGETHSPPPQVPRSRPYPSESAGRRALHCHLRVQGHAQLAVSLQPVLLAFNPSATRVRF